MLVGFWLIVSCVLVTNFLVSSVTSLQHTSVIQIESGKIRGSVESVSTGQFSKYLGIPYANGTRRFENPSPPEKWTGVKNMTSFGKICYHKSFTSPFESKKKDMSEDCLNLNVYVPHVTSRNLSTNPLPVMVWIHGGGFNFHSNRISEGSYLATLGEVIVVSINYRLGWFGFLAVPDYGFKGNYGLFDQVAALQWVQTNINVFGGDPTKVTIFGNSAGGISVSFLCLSPKAEGLFKYAIMQSGVAIAPYGFDPYYKGAKELLR